MTALSSTGNFSRFGTYFLYKLRSLRSLIIMNGIFALLSYPLAFTALNLYSNAYGERHAMQLDGLTDTLRYDELSRRVTAMNGFFIVTVIIGVIMLMAMFLMSYIIPAKSFRWLHRKTVVDMDYSLPVSDDTRFFGDLLAGLAGSLVPHGLAAAIGYLLLNTAASGFIGTDEDILIFDFIREVVLQGMLTGLFACVMFTAFSLLIMSVCGRTAESRIYPFVLNTAIPIIHIVCLYIVLGNVRGYEMGTFDSSMDSVAASSPLGMLGVTLPNFLSFTYNEEFCLPLFRAEVFIPALTVVLACLAGAYFLIKFRRAERVGQPFVYRAIKLLIPALVTFAVVAPFANTVLPEMFGDGDPEYSYSPPVGSLIFAMVIATFVLYVIMELISGRGFRKFYITLGKYAATLAGCVLICLGLYFSEGFGIGRAVPAPDDVSEVYFALVSYEDGYGDFYSDVSEKANIQAVADMHRAIIDSPEEPSLFNIDIRYKMNNGTYLARQYRVSEELYSKYIRELITPEAYYRSFSGYLDVLSGATIVEIDTLALNGRFAVNIPSETFRQALLRDCEKVSYEKLFGDSSEAIPSRSIEITTYDPENVPSYSSLMGNKKSFFEVLGWYENVIALLEQNGVKLGFALSN